MPSSHLSHLIGLQSERGKMDSSHISPDSVAMESRIVSTTVSGMIDRSLGLSSTCFWLCDEGLV